MTKKKKKEKNKKKKKGREERRKRKSSLEFHPFSLHSGTRVHWEQNTSH